MKIRHENLKIILDEQKGAATRVAKRLDVTKGMVSQWKHGTEDVPEQYTEAICDVLGVTEDALCKRISTFRPEIQDSEEMRLLLKVAHNLTPEGLNKVLLEALQVKQLEELSRHGS